MALVQSSLNLQVAPTYHESDFVLSKSNDEAYHWIHQWPQWPAHCLIIYGTKGCGKTHLAHIWTQKTSAKLLDKKQWQNFNLEDWNNNPCPLVLENIDENIDQEHLLHLYNFVKEQRQFLLLTAETLPKTWGLILADLSSRLNATPSVAIHPPDDELLKAIMIKLFADQQITLQTNVVDFLLPRIERSFENVKNIAQKINAHALAKQRKITIPLVREVLLQSSS